MVITLLITTFVVAFAVASLVVFIFDKPIDSILKRVVLADISYAWVRYLRFAIYVVGIGGGVRVWSFEKYLISALLLLLAGFVIFRVFVRRDYMQHGRLTPQVCC